MITINIVIDEQKTLVNLNNQDVLNVETAATKEKVVKIKQANSAKTSVFKTCKKCGKSFKPKSNAQKLCSEACGMKPKLAKHIRNKNTDIIPADIVPETETVTPVIPSIDLHDDDDEIKIPIKITEVKTITEEQILRSKDKPYNS